MLKLSEKCKKCGNWKLIEHNQNQKRTNIKINFKYCFCKSNNKKTNTKYSNNSQIHVKMPGNTLKKEKESKDLSEQHANDDNADVWNFCEFAEYMLLLS